MIIAQSNEAKRRRGIVHVPSMDDFFVLSFELLQVPFPLSSQFVRLSGCFFSSLEE